MATKKEPKTCRTWKEVVEELKKKNYFYVWRPQYMEDLAEGPRCGAAMGMPSSAKGGADLMMTEYDVRLDTEKCTGCGNCWVYCPLGVVYQDENGQFGIMGDYCRACGACVEECPTQAIEMIKIER